MSHHHHHNECNHGSCSHDAHHHEEECSCCCHKHEDECHFSDQLLELADDAWMCLLKEKIKAQIEKSSGKQLDELAKLVNETNHQRWHETFAVERHDETYKTKLREYFHQMNSSKK